MSNAVGEDRVSKIVGYKLSKGNFATSSPNLPQRIAIIGEANHANQATLDTNPTEIFTAQQAGEKYGYGSPIYHALRILRPISGDGVGGIPTVVYAQAAAGGATTKKITITPSGTATGNGTHTLVIAGRKGLDGIFYDVNIVAGDSTGDIAAKIEDAVNAVLGAPCIATSDEYETVCESKWKGLTANDLTITVDTNGNDLGISYAISSTQAGSGTPSISAALNAFGNAWNTIVVNCYGVQSNILSALESFNGVPDATTPTGRYAGIVFKPFIAITGSTADDISATTDARKTQCTIAIAPAPLSKGFHFEAAANMAYLFANTSQNTSNQMDVMGQNYPDMPVPSDNNIGSMASYTYRDAFVKKGLSTVDLVANIYQVCDFVTTYHPDGETPPQYRYCRNLMLDFNVRYGYFLLEQTHVVGKTIAADNDTVTATGVIKPKQWKQIVRNYGADLAARGLLVDLPFFENSITVSLSTSNPDRLETFFKIKRSGVARISATVAEAGFNFGTLTV